MSATPSIQSGNEFVTVLVLQAGEDEYAEAVYGRDGLFRFGYDDPPIDGVEDWLLLPKRKPTEDAYALKSLMDSLKKAAEAATPGPWIATDDSIQVSPGGYSVPWIVGTGGFGEPGWFNTEEDQQYIAAADPTTILMILDELECSMKLNDLTEDHISPAHWRAIWAELENAKMDKGHAKEEADDLRKDAERYRFIRDHKERSFVAITMQNGSEPDWVSGDEMDAQIDARIEQENEP